MRKPWLASGICVLQEVGSDGSDEDDMPLAKLASINSSSDSDSDVPLAMQASQHIIWWHQPDQSLKKVRLQTSSASKSKQLPNIVANLLRQNSFRTCLNTCFGDTKINRMYSITRIPFLLQFVQLAVKRERPCQVCLSERMDSLHKPKFVSSDENQILNIYFRITLIYEVEWFLFLIQIPASWKLVLNYIKIATAWRFRWAAWKIAENTVCTKLHVRFRRP